MERLEVSSADAALLEQSRGWKWMSRGGMVGLGFIPLIPFREHLPRAVIGGLVIVVGGLATILLNYGFFVTMRGIVRGYRAASGMREGLASGKPDDSFQSGLDEPEGVVPEWVRRRCPSRPLWGFRFLGSQASFRVVWVVALPAVGYTLVAVRDAMRGEDAGAIRVALIGIAVSGLLALAVVAGGTWMVAGDDFFMRCSRVPNRTFLVRFAEVSGVELFDKEPMSEPVVRVQTPAGGVLVTLEHRRGMRDMDRHVAAQLLARAEPGSRAATYLGIIAGAAPR